MKGYENKMMPADVCEHIVEAIAEAYRSAPEQCASPADSLAISLASQADALTSQGNGIAIASAALAVIALIAGIAWYKIIRAEAKDEARRVAESEARDEARKVAEAWLAENGPEMLRDYEPLIDGNPTAQKDVADSIGEQAG